MRLSETAIKFTNFTMNKIIEQRVCLEFCVANGRSCADSLKMLERAYGESVFSKTWVHQ